MHTLSVLPRRRSRTTPGSSRDSWGARCVQPRSKCRRGTSPVEGSAAVVGNVVSCHPSPPLSPGESSTSSTTFQSRTLGLVSYITHTIAQLTQPIMSIPVVDVSTESIEENSAVLQQIHNAFTAVGFLFVRGHGIPREMVGAMSIIEVIMTSLHLLLKIMCIFMPVILPTILV